MNADRQSCDEITRRSALKSAGVFGAMVAGGAGIAQAADGDSDDATGRVELCLFSKPLQNRSVEDLAHLLNRMGIGGVDLTCRPGGHVLPERVVDDLPRAHEQLARAGIRVPMITTGITEANKDRAEEILRTAASLGIRYAKLGYYKYGDLHRISERLAEVKAHLREIVAIAGEHGVRLGFHNHSGGYVGSPMWDVRELIEDLPAEVIGSYFDVRHATTEGGLEGWRIGMHLLAPRMIMVALKDFEWRRDKKRGWRAENVPLGEGMVRLEEALRQLKQMKFAGPLSLHMEHGEHGPAVDSASDRVNLAAIRLDWGTLLGAARRVGLV